MLFRQSALIIPEWFQYVYNGDYALALIISLNGKIKYIDEIIGVYRKTSGGLNSKIKDSFVWFKIYEMLSFLISTLDFSIINQYKKKNQLVKMIPTLLEIEKGKIEKLMTLAFYKRYLKKILKP